MGKKGISPLIATVILIGFTIVLAAVVIRWGGDFINETTETTTCESDLATICATQLNLEIVGAGVSITGIDGNSDILGKNITIRNNADYLIDSFTVVINDASGTLKTLTNIVNSDLPAFEQKTIVLDLTDVALGEGATYTIEVIPTVTAGEDCSGACADTRESIEVIATA